MKNKEELYQQAVAKIKEEFEEYDAEGIVAKMATIVAVLKNTFPYYLWCGFYFAEENNMIVGPYQGNLACPNITYDGVCGAGAKRKDTVIVPDVTKFPGHIFCDTSSKSEIVIPVMDSEGRLVGVLDVDSHVLDAFDEIDKKYLELIIPMLFEEKN